MTHDEHHSNTIYYKVFGALLVLTVITVALTNLKVGVALAVTLALIVATIKASLVASFFMHLIAERKLIYMILIFTAIFFAGMVGFIIGAKYDTPEGTVYLEKTQAKVAETDDHKTHNDDHKGGHH